MKRFVYRHILLPAFESGLKRRKTLRYWRGLEETQWLPRPEIERLQFAALQRLIAHAYKGCAYYRREWERLGLQPDHLRSAADYSRWPLIDRETVREHRINMRAQRPGLRLITKATGGSSGVPLRFDLDEESHERRTAAWHRGYGWAGAAPGTKQLYLWGVPIGERPLRSRVKERLYAALHRRRVVSCFEIGDAMVDRFVSEITRMHPDAVVAYTNPLYEVARRIKERGIWIDPPGTIVLGAERVHEFQRELIERVFRAPVYETYGSREFMLIGAECERHTGLHLTAEQLLVEVLDDDGRPTPDGAEGNIVITDLYNYGMPFIRYANGDRAIAGFRVCPCGRGLPILQRVVGRRLDVIVGSGGRLIPGEFFPHLVKDFPAVRRFQVVQEEPARVRFALEAPELGGDDRARLERLVRGALGPGVRVEFEPVAHIPLTAAGKLQVVVNQMQQRRAA